MKWKLSVFFLKLVKSILSRNQLNLRFIYFMAAMMNFFNPIIRYWKIFFVIQTLQKYLR